jgi:peroxiredoxin
VAVVTFETVATVRAYVEDTGTRWPILVDPTREIYRRYGIHRGRIWNVWGLPSWRSYFKEFAKGAFPKPLRADSLQLGADLLIDPSGIIRFRHVGRGPGDRPEVEELLRTLEQLRQLKIG